MAITCPGGPDRRPVDRDEPRAGPSRLQVDENDGQGSADAIYSSCAPVVLEPYPVRYLIFGETGV
jgi:hypothetical protein